MGVFFTRYAHVIRLSWLHSVILQHQVFFLGGRGEVILTLWSILHLERTRLSCWIYNSFLYFNFLVLYLFSSYCISNPHFWTKNPVIKHKPTLQSLSQNTFCYLIHAFDLHFVNFLLHFRWIYPLHPLTLGTAGRELNTSHLTTVMTPVAPLNPRDTPLNSW